MQDTSFRHFYMVSHPLLLQMELLSEHCSQILIEVENVGMRLKLTQLPQ